MAMMLRCLLLAIPKTPSPSPSPSPFFFTFFTFCAPSSAPPSSPICHFLETDCHFSPSQISKIIKARNSLMKVRSTHTARQAVEFLRERGFTHSQLHSTILGYPPVLTRTVDGHLKPIFDLFTILGFSNQDLRYVISKGPRVLGCSLERKLKPRIPFLQQLFGSKDSLIKGLKTAPQLLNMSIEKQLKPKLHILQKWGIEGEPLSLLLSIRTHAMARISLELFETRVEYVRNTLGVVEGSKPFVYAVGLLLSTGHQNFEKKVKHLESLGLLKEEVRQLLRKNPLAFLVSTEKMQRNMDFLTHTAGFQPNVVVSYGNLLNYSVENRLKPRLAVFQALCAMQQPTPKLSSILSLSEKRFLENVVECSPHASILKDIYERKVNSADVEST